MSNRFDSYLKGAKLARMLAAQATEKFYKGEDRKALRDIIAAFNALLVATNNFAHLQFKPRKKNPLGLSNKKAAKLYPAPLLHINNDFPSDKIDTGGAL